MSHNGRMGIRDANILTMEFIDMFRKKINTAGHIYSRDRNTDHGNPI